MSLDEQLSAALERRRPADGFADRVLARAREERRRRSLRRRALAAAAGVVFAVLAGAARLRPPRRPSPVRRRLVAVALLAAGLATGCGSTAYRSTVSAIDRLPEARRVRVPFLGVARVASNLAGGPKGLRLAVFETSAAPEPPVGEVLTRNAGPRWQRLLRARSEGEDVVLLARPDGDRMRLLLLAQEPGEVVVLEVSIAPEELLATIDDRGERFR